MENIKWESCSISKSGSEKIFQNQIVQSDILQVSKQGIKC